MVIKKIYCDICEKEITETTHPMRFTKQEYIPPTATQQGRYKAQKTFTVCKNCECKAKQFFNDEI